MENKVKEQGVEAALRGDVRLNLNNVIQYSAYYQGARMAAMRLMEGYFMDRVKGNEKVYMKAELELIKASLENAEKFLSGSPIGYRNHERNKRGKLVKCEAYFM